MKRVLDSNHLSISAGLVEKLEQLEHLSSTRQTILILG